MVPRRSTDLDQDGRPHGSILPRPGLRSPAIGDRDSAITMAAGGCPCTPCQRPMITISLLHDLIRVTVLPAPSVFPDGTGRLPAVPAPASPPSRDTACVRAALPSSHPP